MTHPNGTLCLVLSNVQETGLLPSGAADVLLELCFIHTGPCCGLCLLPQFYGICLPAEHLLKHLWLEMFVFPLSSIVQATSAAHVLSLFCVSHSF